MAAWLGADHVDFRGDDAVGAAWIQRAAKLLEGQPPCSEHGLIALLEADYGLLDGGDPRAAAARAQEAIELARAVGDPDVEVVGLALRGSALVEAGDVTE